LSRCLGEAIGLVVCEGAGVAYVTALSGDIFQIGLDGREVSAIA